MKHRLHDEVSSIRMGDIADFTNYRGAVIDEKTGKKNDNPKPANPKQP